jgi:hypothetical protein
LLGAATLTRVKSILGEHDIEVARREYVRMERAHTSLINYRSHHTSLFCLFFHQLFTSKSVASTSQGLWHDRAQNVLAASLMCFVNFVEIYEFLMEMTTQDFRRSPLFPLETRRRRRAKQKINCLPARDEN